MPGPRQEVVEPNRYGFLPPAGCIVCGKDGSALNVTTPRDQKILWEQSLLIEDESLEPIITQLVQRSATLKARFAFRLSTSEVRVGRQVSSAVHWNRAWELIKQHEATWIEQLEDSEDGANRWEMGQPHSIAELHARVLVVLRQNVQDNNDRDSEKVFGLK
jgi:hypothetical protein